MLPTRGQVYGLFLQILDDPAARVFTDVPNATTGALSVFQAGFSQAFDLLFNNALNQQVSQVEEVVDGIIVPANPGRFSLSPAEMGLPDFADWEWISERTAGSTDKFIDLRDEDRLTQRPAVDRLIETVWQNGAFQFVGCTSVRELQIKYVASGVAPISNSTIIPFDGSLNFLANYSAKIGKNKGRADIARDAMIFAVGPKFDYGVIGGELFRLMQPLVRTRQNVQAAHKPYTTQRRLRGRRGLPYVAAQQGTTGGGAQNVPLQYASTQGTIIGAIDGVNTVFYLTAGQVMSMTLFRNGFAQMPGGVDYTSVNNMITFQAASVPLPGDYLTAEAYLGYGIPA